MSVLGSLARIFGWSPIDKYVSITIDESEDTSLLKRIIKGKIISIGGAGIATLQLDPDSGVLLRNIETVGLRIRHTGYDLYHLPIGKIAVSVEVNGSDSSDSRIASGMMKVE